jgi:colicin import membrane protein
LSNNKNSNIIIIIITFGAYSMIQPSLPTDIRERIIAAAQALYEQNGRSSFPSVDMVRKAARVNMNDASAVMKEWRRAQTTQAAPVAVTVPEAVTQANSQALAALWAQAQELANESLRTAQAAWEAERGELDALRQELADAYETQAAEFEQAKLQAEADRDAYQVAAQRAADLRAELDRAHQEADQARAMLAEQQHAAQVIAVERDQTKAELVKAQASAEAQAEAYQEQRQMAAQEAARQAERYTKAQAERDQAQQAAAEARERAAELSGKLSAIQEQNAALLARLTPVEAEATSSKTTRKKP